MHFESAVDMIGTTEQQYSKNIENIKNVKGRNGHSNHQSNQTSHHV